MIKKLYKVTAGFIITAGLISASVMANDLNRLEIKKSNSSDSALNVTVYTTSPYDENVAVTKKSDNKYVILLPNVSNSSASSTDYSSISDVVSSVDIKSVEDGVDGYTKVTLTTTKPVTITASTRKSSPLTPEQKAYKNLIAQSRGITADTSDPYEEVSSSSSTNTNSEPLRSKAPIPGSGTVSSSVPVSKTVQAENKPAQETVAAGNNLKKNGKKITEEKTEVKSLLKLQDTKKSEADAKKAADEEPESAAVTSDAVSKPVSNAISSDTAGRRIQPDVFAAAAMLFCLLAGLGLLCRFMKNRLKRSVELKKSFKENLSQRPVVINDYSSIANDSSLSWQEKYRRYMNSTARTQSLNNTAKNTGNSRYEAVNSAGSISNPAKPEQTTQGYSGAVNPYAQSAQPKSQKEADKITPYNKTAANSSPEGIPPVKKIKNQNLEPAKAPKLEVVKNQTSNSSKEYKDLEDSLERTLHKSPSVEKTNLNDEIGLQQKSETSPAKDVSPNKEPVVVHKEEDKIAETIRKAPKLKSFANKIALEEAKRNVPLPKKRSEIVKSRNIESKHVELGNSGLYSSRRRLGSGNLSAMDLINRTYNAKAKTAKPAEGLNGYTMSTIDEFFDTIDSSSHVTAPSSLTNRVAESLNKMTPGARELKTANSQPPNPLEGKVIKAGYNIDKTSGFYIVSDKQGKSSLIGRVNDEITVLKNFDNPADGKLQVRMNDPNVYMVRTGKERYLVEVNNNKMGVLLEL